MIKILMNHFICGGALESSDWRCLKALRLDMIWFGLLMHFFSLNDRNDIVTIFFVCLFKSVFSVKESHTSGWKS